MGPLYNNAFVPKHFEVKLNLLLLQILSMKPFHEYVLKRQADFLNEIAVELIVGSDEHNCLDHEMSNTGNAPFEEAPSVEVPVIHYCTK